jgi:hypothetical protein
VRVVHASGGGKSVRSVVPGDPRRGGGLDTPAPGAYHRAMPTTITGTKAKAKPRPRVNAEAIEAEVAEVRALLIRHCWGVAEHSYRDPRNRPVFLLEARWSGTDSRVRVESPDRAGAWREVLRRAGTLGLLGPESRPRGWRPRRRRRAPRMINFSDLGPITDSW